MAIDGLGTFGNDDNRIHPAFAVPGADLGGHLVHVKGNFGDQDGLGGACNAGMQRDPAGIAAHDLDHHHPLVAFGSAMQAIQTLRCKADGRIETEGGEGLVQVVVDRLGHTHHPQPLLVQGIGNGQRAIATNRNQCVDLLPGKKRQDVPRKIHVLRRAIGHFHRKMQGIALVGGAEDGAAKVSDATHPVPREAEHATIRITFGKKYAVETFANSVAFPTPMGSGNCHRPDHGIEARGIAAAGANSYSSNVTGHGDS